MNKLIVLLFFVLGSSFVMGQSTQQIEEYTQRDVTNFSTLVQGEIPALSLNSDQLKSIEGIFRKKHNEAAKLDPYKIGKLNAQKGLMDLEKNAIIDAMAVLTVEQRVAYKRNLDNK